MKNLIFRAVLSFSIIFSGILSSPTGVVSAVSPIVVNLDKEESGSNIRTADMGPCTLFPLDNIWNARVDTLPVNARSTYWINSIGRTTGFHMDFGSGTWDGGPIGIPFNIVEAGVSPSIVSFYYPDESDDGPYPIPSNPLMEYGSDHHILIVDKSTCKLYEIYDASKTGSNWSAGSGAVWDLTSNTLRPDGWTSADAAGLPILPGLVRYDEIVSGKIEHALRFTASQTNKYTWPARHLTSNDSTNNIPPMGARFRLKAGYDISQYSPEMQIILTAMKKYGIILADNGSDWYVSGAPDDRWDNDMLHTLDALTGDDFEAVDSSLIQVSADSGQVKPMGLSIKGNTGTGGVTLTYTDSIEKTVISDKKGNYTISVPADWSGSVTPSKIGVISFSPVNRVYSSLDSPQTTQNFRPNTLKTFVSNAGKDGYLLESGLIPGQGGTVEAKGQVIFLGDDALNRQYRALLSFATSSLPDKAVIVSADLYLTEQNMTAEEPFTNLGSLILDIRKLYFGKNASLGLDDFSALPGSAAVGIIDSSPVSGVFHGSLDASAFPYVNLKGETQLRMEYSQATDNDLTADFLSIYSGNSPISANRPILKVLYYLP